MDPLPWANPAWKKMLYSVCVYLVRSAMFTTSRFILGEHDHQQKIADAIHSIENLTLEERFMICMAPVNQRCVEYEGKGDIQAIAAQLAITARLASLVGSLVT